jgi:integrase
LAKNPVVRISNLIAAFSGARLAEIVEANKADFEWDGGHLVFHVRLDNRAETEDLKTEGSVRRFPLHSAIRDEVAAYLDIFTSRIATVPQGGDRPRWQAVAECRQHGHAVVAGHRDHRQAESFSHSQTQL